MRVLTPTSKMVVIFDAASSVVLQLTQLVCVMALRLLHGKQSLLHTGTTHELRTAQAVEAFHSGDVHHTSIE